MQKFIFFPRVPRINNILSLSERENVFHFLCHISFSGLQVYEKISSINIIEGREAIFIF